MPTAMSCVSGWRSTYARTYGQDAITRSPRRRASSRAKRTSPEAIPLALVTRQHLSVDQRQPAPLLDVVEEASEITLDRRLVAVRGLGIHDHRRHAHDGTGIARP